jgi:hypothetical protein
MCLGARIWIGETERPHRGLLRELCKPVKRLQRVADLRLQPVTEDHGELTHFLYPNPVDATRDC